MPGKRQEKPEGSRRGTGRRKKATVEAEPAAVNGLHEILRPEVAAALGIDQEDAYMGTARYGDADILEAEWFLEPWIARGVHTLLVGLPSCGKSTFAAHLARKANRTVFLCGEEDIRRAVLGRLKTNGVSLPSVIFCPAGDSWTFPRHEQKLIQLIRHERADLVIVDPADSYVGGGTDENQNLPVRKLLDVFFRAAEATQCAMVLMRHPGKDRTNLVAGSRAWFSHPRAILHLATLPDNRERGVLKALKPPLGQWPPPQFYNLVGWGRHPREFHLAGEAPECLAREMESVMDGMDRTKIDEAETLLKRFLADGAELSAADLYKMAEQHRLSDRTLRYAAERLHVKRRHEGSREATVVYWKLPPAAARERPDAGA